MCVWRGVHVAAVGGHCVCVCVWRGVHVAAVGGHCVCVCGGGYM